MNPLIETVCSSDPTVRNRAFGDLCRGISTAELLDACKELEAFRRTADNLYERVRATLFLYAAYRFFLMEAADTPKTGVVPFDGYADILERRFERAIARFRGALESQGPNAALFSALAEGYHHLAFQTLLDQVQRSVRTSRGNQWMFRVGTAQDHPVRIRPELLRRAHGALLYPILTERTPVRLDLSHSGWSDIFFLGMDFPEGARVLNISVDLGVYGRDTSPRPPVETYVRALEEPLIRLTSVDLQATKDVTDLRDLFNFGNDYLGLLKAGVIASGIVPPSLEGADEPLAAIMAAVVGPGMGLELVTKVNDIPKGSRLAVSTTLLASIVSVLMRATGQTRRCEGDLAEEERRLAASRAILGEWLGGSGGGWQDSGGIWPGVKVIAGARAEPGDPEYGISNGRLLPQHRVLDEGAMHPDLEARLAGSLVPAHGGMAQNVGPILEMVTEKYLLRGRAEWDARLAMAGIFDAILEALKSGDIQTLAANTTRNWDGPLKTIIPYVTNCFTETVIARAKRRFGNAFWGFLMLGGMSGGGMAMFVAPECRDRFRSEIREIMTDAKNELEDALPFAMDPLVYDFAINRVGTTAHFAAGDDALMPAQYYAVQVPELVAHGAADLPYQRRAELDQFTAQTRSHEDTFTMLRSLVGNLFKLSGRVPRAERVADDEEAERLKAAHGFDAVQHERIRADLRNGRIGLARNRLPVDTVIEDVRDSDLACMGEHGAQAGESALGNGRVAVLSLAGGVGSRWTTGAGVVKSVNPFVDIGGRHRTFIEVHLAKTARTSRHYGAPIPHIISTSFITHGPIEKHLALNENFGYTGSLHLSPGRSIGQRLIPMVRDLVFLWEEMPQETLDEQKQKVREAVRGALMDWAREKGEGADYVDNVALQRFSPPGHWYEVPNLFQNGVLRRVLEEHPRVETIMLHNIDTLGADVAPEPLGIHIESGNALTFEVAPRRIVDRGGGLARVNGKVRLLEGLAQPREEDELSLRYYNTMTTWVQLEPLLAYFGLTRGDIMENRADRITAAIRGVAQRMPTYVTIKDVKFRWGQGQEDVYPVAQFEKLWSDMTALPDLQSGYIAVPRLRGQQLKDPEELDAWANDGSKQHVAFLCDFS